MLFDDTLQANYLFILKINWNFVVIKAKNFVCQTKQETPMPEIELLVELYSKTVQNNQYNQNGNVVRDSSIF